jgi:BirA family transcriptional regulator, biotin operon repressor / biotin---[acetyl-CoA-carboxylase] ligase
MPLRRRALPRHHAGPETSMNDARHLAWGAQDLWQQLSPLLPGLSVEVMARLESTNTELLERARAGDAPGPRGRRLDDTLPCLLVAEHQTHGRGRHGRDWVASPGASLTFSLLLRLAPVSWSGLSLAVGCAIADALDPGPVPRIGLKWPNDLWLIDRPGRGRKLGGILIETVNIGPHRMAVVGVGLNVLVQAADGLAHGYACVAELDPAATAPSVLATVAGPLVRALQQFESAGFPAFRDDFARRDLLAGHPLVTQGGGVPIEGTGDGVDSDGALRLRTADGTVLRLASGEVSVRLK